MKIGANSTLVMIGDSITDCGRARPVGEGGGIGDGYVRFVDATLGTLYPGSKIRVLNTGISGNTVRDLVQRWQTDVLDLKPDWVSVMIGTNDVWRQFDQPKQPAAGVPLDEYRDLLNRLVGQTFPHVQGVVLCTPFFIEPLKSDAMRSRMDEYSEVVRATAKAHNCILVDTQDAFDKLLVSQHSSAISWDRVHPNATGHMAIAKAFLDAIEVDWTR